MVTFYRSWEEMPDIPRGLAIYQVAFTSPIPSDDGDHGFRMWCFASGEHDALEQATAWLQGKSELIEITNIERETPDVP